ncbi:MAG: HEPN domain-containing protein, partial [Firmicutes bacterium]|nr:HEPN domain-containing protein [Bacillota bacterium]
MSEGKQWLRFAFEDLKMARLALSEQIFNQACFHAQQCAEKALKGIILSARRPVPRTHKLADLAALLEGRLPEDLLPRIVLLDRFYTTTRYPDALPGYLPEGLPGREESEEAVSAAAELFDLARKLLGS